MAESAAKAGTNSPPPSWLQKHGQKLFAAVFWLLLVGAYVIYTARNGLTPLETFRQLVGFLSANAYGPLLFILLYTLRPLIFFSALVLSVGAGFLYGPVLGILYTIIGANLGASLAYVIGTFFGRGVLAEGSDKPGGRLQGYADRLRRNAFETVLTMRFLFLPYDLVNYLAGFLRVRYMPFILATVLGSLPGTVAFVLFGASTDGDFSNGLPSVNAGVLVASVAIFALSLLGSRLLKRREQGRKGQERA